MFCSYCEEPLRREDATYNRELEAFICDACNHEINERFKHQGERNVKGNSE